MKKKKGKTKIIIFVALLVLSLGLTIGCVGLVYKNGVDQFTSGDFDKAEKTFGNISFLSGAKTYLDYIRVLKENNIATDELLQFLAEEGNTKEGKETFTKYIDAITNFNNGKYQRAQEVFDEIADFQNVDEYLDMLDAMEAFRKKDYETMESLLSIKDYEEGSHLEKLKSGYLNYIEAEKALSAKEYYRAYSLFVKAGNIEDAPERLKECSVSMSTSTIYLDSSIVSHDIDLVFIADELQDRLVKVYDSTGKRVIEAYLSKGTSKTYSIDEGEYRIAFGCGDNYFGDKDLFGEDIGSYYRVILDGQELYSYSKGFNYTIKLSKTEGVSRIRFEEITIEEFRN
ncbi:MAG: hypothetical protein II126_03560 [Erysipelotrichaceae bacterium]|nr:hypothetical protein [Erysipelotrichaceae bacterium]